MLKLSEEHKPGYFIVKDKVLADKIDEIIISTNSTDPTLTNGQIVIGSTGSTPVASTITGTANQVVVTNGSGSITLSTPQNIATTSSPTFANIIISGDGTSSDPSLKIGSNGDGFYHDFGNSINLSVNNVSRVSFTDSVANFDVPITTNNADITVGAVLRVDNINENTLSNGVIINTKVIFNDLVFYTGTKQTLTGAGAVNITNRVTLVATTGANALTLAAGVEGLEKVITMITDGGDGTLTVTNPIGYTTITFNDIGDTVVLEYINTKWVIKSNFGCTVA